MAARTALKLRIPLAGACLTPASAPQLLRATEHPTTLELSFIAGTAGDCVFAGFQLQIATGSTFLDAACTMLVREGPQCRLEELQEATQR